MVTFVGGPLDGVWGEVTRPPIVIKVLLASGREVGYVRRSGDSRRYDFGGYAPSLRVDEVATWKTGA
jgi:hypothetical protein